MNDFQVQLCSEELENIKGMYKIVKPDRVVVSQIGVEEADEAILEWLQNKTGDTPVLFIAIWDKWNRYKVYCEGEKFDKLFRPVSKEELLEKCYKMTDSNNLSTLKRKAEGPDSA